MASVLCNVKKSLSVPECFSEDILTANCDKIYYEEAWDIRMARLGVDIEQLNDEFNETCNLNDSQILPAPPPEMTQSCINPCTDSQRPSHLSSNSEESSPLIRMTNSAIADASMANNPVYSFTKRNNPINSHNNSVLTCSSTSTASSLSRRRYNSLNKSSEGGRMADDDDDKLIINHNQCYEHSASLPRRSFTQHHQNQSSPSSILSKHYQKQSLWIDRDVTPTPSRPLGITIPQSHNPTEVCYPSSTQSIPPTSSSAFSCVQPVGGFARQISAPSANYYSENGGEHSNYYSQASKSIKAIVNHVPGSVVSQHQHKASHNTSSKSGGHLTNSAVSVRQHHRSNTRHQQQQSHHHLQSSRQRSGNSITATNGITPSNYNSTISVTPVTSVTATALLPASSSSRNLYDVAMNPVASSHNHNADINNNSSGSESNYMKHLKGQELVRNYSMWQPQHHAQQQQQQQLQQKHQQQQQLVQRLQLHDELRFYHQGNNTSSSINRQLDMIADSNRTLEEHLWYHPQLTRCEAELLLSKYPEGSFLVRPSQSTSSNGMVAAQHQRRSSLLSDEYSLSIRYKQKWLHMKITRDADGQFVLGQYSQPYPSIPIMIRHYSSSYLPVKGANLIALTQPIFRAH